MADQKAVRAELEEKLDRMFRQHGKLSAHLKNEDRTVPIDWSERAQFLENDEVLEALEDRTRERIEALTLALHRMDEGIWSTCANCGKEISDERLDILPTTTVCAACA